MGGGADMRFGIVNVPFSGPSPNVVLSPATLPTGTEGSPTGTITLATFTDPGGAESPSDYSATVDWGDGSTGGATPTIVQSGSTFLVQDTHTWKDDSTGNGESTFNVTVTVTHESSTAQSITEGATVLEPSVMFASPPLFYTTEPSSGVAASSAITVVLSGNSDDAVTVDYETIENPGCG